MMGDDYKRPDPDALLVQLRAEQEPKRGRLRLWLGVAPGAGTTYAMLQEGHRRKSRGTDVVIGFVETHGRPRTAEQIGDLEIVPPREVVYKGVTLREMDTDAILARRPQVALVDELAHTNAPGSKHEKRYQDVFELLEAGIEVHSTMNIQHLESLHDSVEQITGVCVRETVPDWILDEADEIELVDMAPEALIRRMIHGNIYPPEQAKRALEHFFTLRNLAALRDLSLRITASELESKLAVPKDGRGEHRETGEKVMVAVDHRPSAKTLIREGWRMASALRGELIVVHVEPTHGRRRALSVAEERQLRSNLQLADELRAKVVHLRGEVSQELIEYARLNQVSQLIIGTSVRSRWSEVFHGSVTSDILRGLPGVDIHVIPARELAQRG